MPKFLLFYRYVSFLFHYTVTALESEPFQKLVTKEMNFYQKYIYHESFSAFIDFDFQFFICAVYGIPGDRLVRNTWPIFGIA